MFAGSLVLNVTAGEEEGLADLLLRSASINYIDPSILWELARPRIGGYRQRVRFTPSNVLFRAGELVKFSRLIGCNVKEICSRICPGGDPKQIETVRFFGAEIRRSNISPHRRVAPRYLLLNGCQRALWSLHQLDFDPDTREQLIEFCPGCGNSRLSWTALTTDFCSSCGACIDLRKCSAPVVSIEDEEAFALLVQLIAPNSPRTALRQLAPAIRSVPRGALFDLVVDLAHLRKWNGAGGVDWSTRLTCQNLVEASRLLLNWPDSVGRLLRPLVTVDGPNGRCRSAVFTELLRRTKDSRLAKLLLFVALGIRVLPGDPARALPRRKGAGAKGLAASPMKGHGAEPCEDIDAMRRSRPLAHSCRAIGLSLPSLLHLVQLDSGRGPAIDIACDIAAHLFQADLLDQATQKTRGAQVSLRSLVNCTFLKDFDVWPAILMRLIDSSAPLAYTICCAGPNLVGRIHVPDTADLLKVLADCEAVSTKYWEARLTQSEALGVLQVDYLVLEHYQKIGLLPLYLSLAALRDFRTRYITAVDLRNRLKPACVVQPYLSEVLNSLDFPPITKICGVPLWRRGEIEQALDGLLIKTIE